MFLNILVKVFCKFFIVFFLFVEVVFLDLFFIENWGGWFCDVGLKVNNEVNNF